MDEGQEVMDDDAKSMIPLDMETPPATPPGSIDYSSMDENSDDGGMHMVDTISDQDSSKSDEHEGDEDDGDSGEAVQDGKHVIHVPTPVFGYRHQLISV